MVDSKARQLVDLSQLEILARGEMVEARGIEGLLEMLAWDLGYQDKPLPDWLLRLGSDYGIDVRKEHLDGRWEGVIHNTY